MQTSLVVTPTEQTRKRLEEMVASTILTLDFELMAIEIAAYAGEGPVDWTEESVTVYDDVQVTSVFTESSSVQGTYANTLVATVRSEKLKRRSHMLGGTGDTFRWPLKYDVQPGRSARLVITNLEDALVYREAPFSFTDEMVLRF